MDINQLKNTSNRWNSIISYKQASESRASFHLLSGVNLDIPLVSGNLNVKETLYTNLLRH